MEAFQAFIDHNQESTPQKMSEKFGQISWYNDLARDLNVGRQ